MKCAITSSTARAGAAIAVATAAGLLVAMPAAAASSINITQDLPTAPVQATVGDVIDITLPAVDFEPPPGFSGGGLVEYPMPYASDGGVLPKISGAYDATGTLHEEFSAAKAGTAMILVGFPFEGPICPTTTTSTSTSSSSTSSTTSTSTSHTAADTECLAVDPRPLRNVTVVVSATHVEGAVVVPPTGSGGSSTVGFGIALLGVIVTCVNVLVLRDEQRRRR